MILDALRFILLVCLLIIVYLSFCRNDKVIRSKEFYPTGELRVEITEEIDNNRKCGIFYRKDGTREKQYCFQDGQLDGEFLEYHADGKTIESSAPYKLGSVEGMTKEFYPNGEIKETMEYVAGKKCGFAYFYYRDGSLKAVNYFQEDSICYKKIIDENGKVLYESVYPIVHLDRDTLAKGDTLTVTFSLPDFGDSTEILAPLKNSLVRFNFGRTGFDSTHIYAYPENYVTLSEGTASSSFIMEDTGRHFIYGYLEVLLQDTISYDAFKSKYFYLVDGKKEYFDHN